MKLLRYLLILRVFLKYRVPVKRERERERETDRPRYQNQIKVIEESVCALHYVDQGIAKFRRLTKRLKRNSKNSFFFSYGRDTFICGPLGATNNLRVMSQGQGGVR